jgi:glycosyltransferase involved in cell wall biosynthesis
MKKIGIFVGEENWTFFIEIYKALSDHYETEIYRSKTYNTPLLSGRLNRWAFKHRIQSMLRRNDICFFEWASELLAHASHMPKCSAIVTRLHSFELYGWAPKINWNLVDKVILVSRAKQRQFADLYPDQRHKTVVVYNGRSLIDFKPPFQREFGFKLGMLCDIKPRKRIYDIILNIYELIQKGYNAYLCIGGNPAGLDDMIYAAAINELVDRLGLQDRVSLEGYVENASAWLQEIDIYISNSYWEGQQVALLEAMATGCYCLSHAWSGAEEMLPPDYLYTTNAELKQKIIEYSEMPNEEKQEHQVRLRAIACKNFDIDQTQTRIRNIIDTLDIEKVPGMQINKKF